MEVTEREFQLLYDRVSDLSRRVDTIDLGGTRGIGPLSVQINSLAEKFSDHEKDHASLKAFMRSVLLVILVEGLAIVGQYVMAGFR